MHRVLALFSGPRPALSVSAVAGLTRGRPAVRGHPNGLNAGRIATGGALVRGVHGCPVVKTGGELS